MLNRVQRRNVRGRFDTSVEQCYASLQRKDPLLLNRVQKFGILQTWGKAYSFRKETKTFQENGK